MGTLGKPQSRETWNALLLHMQITRIADVIPCGSYRRGFGICNDLDIATVTPDGNIPEKVYEAMSTLGFKILLHGKKVGRFLLDTQLQVDWYATTEEKIGALMLHLTGSAEFNVGMRGRCKMKGFSFSENGLVSRDDKSMIACKTEEEIFAAIGMSYVPPAERTTFYKALNKYRLP